MNTALLEKLRKRAEPGGLLRFDVFMETALYEPEIGYYRRPRPRVGRGEGTDFFTASSLGTVFGELIVAAATQLLGAEASKSATFLEIGAEPEGSGVLENVSHPFQAHRVIPIGGDLLIRGSCVVFSNELFDAQACRRFRRQAGVWNELWVDLGADDELREVTLPCEAPPEVLPTDAPEGYQLDLPFAAVSLLEKIANQPWTGLFIAADYGKSWAELAQHTPQGTVRAYHRHRQSNDVLAHPGEQDLTCHVCWDWLSEGLIGAGFSDVSLESQEAFFIRNAAGALAAIMHQEAARVSTRKMALMQLLHPSNMGQKFQVLRAIRR